MNGNVVETHELTKRFGGVVAVNHVNFTLRERELRCLIGPNGAGKSTVLNLIGGFYLADSGSVHLGERDISGLSSNRVAQAGLARTYQTAQLFAHMPVIDNVLVALNDDVKKGQKVAVQRNAFGDIVHEYIAEVDGRVAIIGTDAIREHGVDVVSILTNSAACTGGDCPYEGEVP